MAMFEGKFRTDMEEEEAKKLVSEARAAGTLSDLGSGSNVDLCHQQEQAGLSPPVLSAQKEAGQMWPVRV